MDYVIQVILAMGIGLIAFGAIRIYPYHKAKRWQRCSATICSFSEGWNDVVIGYGKVRYFYPKVEYEYDFGGVIYKSSRAGFKDEDVSRPATDAYGVATNINRFPWAAWSEGSTITVYVDPDRPVQSVIFPHLSRTRRSHYLAIMVGGLFLIGMWCLLFWLNQGL